MANPVDTLPALRLGFRLLSAVSPAAAEQSAAALFVRPRRRRSRAPEVPGVPSTAFRLGEGDAALQCWAWGGGPAVLLVHGWEGHSGQLARFVPPLLARGHRVVAFDLPAHGCSGGRVSHLVISTQAVLRVGRVCGPLAGVIAHSFGAAVTTLALLQGLDARRVVLIAAPAEPTLFVRRAAATLGLSSERADGILRRLREQVGVGMETLDLRRQVQELKTPALLVHDPEDPEVPWAHAEDTARLWPGARLVPAAGLGHSRVLRDPGAIGQAVEFIAADEPPRS